MVNINEFYYRDVTDAVIKKHPFKFFRQQYHILTSDHDEKYYGLWTDYLLDSYNKYRSAGFSDFESQTNGLMDGLEGLMKDDK